MMNENNNINEMNNSVATNVNNVLESATESTYEEVIEEGDIVIEEDFQINLDVADVSTDEILTGTSEDALEVNDNNDIQLGTKQSGNITF